MTNYPTRRDFLSFLLQASVGTALEFCAQEAQSVPQKKQRTLQLNYQTILGNDPQNDQRIKQQIQEQYKQRNFEQYLTEEGVAMHPNEDYIIPYVKPATIEYTPPQNKPTSPQYYKQSNTTLTVCDKNNVCKTGHPLEYALSKYTLQNDQALGTLAEKITQGYDSLEEKAQALLCFVQTAIHYDKRKANRASVKINGLPYTDPNKDFIRSPHHTLVDRLGDCKDTSILYASLVAQLNINAIYIELITQNTPHVNIGIALDFEENRIPLVPKSLKLDGKIEYNNTIYYIAETTTDKPLFIGRKLVTERGSPIIGIHPILPA